jgi:polysaccharide biosynthesis protein PslJ
MGATTTARREPSAVGFRHVARSLAVRISPLFVIQVYLVLIIVVPARLIVGPIGQFGTPANLLGVVAFGLWALNQSAVRTPLHQGTTRMVLAPLVYWIPVLISLVAMHRVSFTPSQVNSSDIFVLGLLSWTGISLLCTTALSRSDVDAVVRALTWVAAICSAVGILQFLFGFDLTVYLAKIPGLTLKYNLQSIGSRDTFRRPAGTLIHPIEFGVFCSICLPFAIHRALFDKGRSRIVRYGLCAVIGLGIPLSISRSAMIATGIALFGVWRRLNRSERRRGYLIGLGALVFLFMTIPGLLGTLAGYVIGADKDPSISSRTDDYAVVSFLVNKSPWIGQGAGSYLPVRTPLRKTDLPILDNQFLTTVIETGLFGLVGLCLYFTVPAWTGMRIKHRPKANRSDSFLGQCIAVALLGALVTCISWDELAFPGFSGFTSVLIGLAGALARLYPSSTSHDTTVTRP